MSTKPDVPLLDVVAGNRPLHDEIMAAIRDVFESGRFLHGEPVKQLEHKIAERCGTRHAVGCATGSDALLLSLMSLGIGPGDEVIVPSFTFFATASAVCRLGAKIVFADIDPATFNMAPESVEAAITKRTKAVIPVDLYVRCADLTEINRITNAAGVRMIEDAAQAIGASHRDRAAGAWGDVACFSFYPTKNLGGCGDGGMLTTSDDELADQLRLLGGHGMRPRYVHQVVGIASRLDSVQAAALNVKLNHLDSWTETRRANAERYHELFVDAKLDHMIGLPLDDPHGQHVWNQYTIRIRDSRRDDLREALAGCGIGSEIYYPIPLHQQECFRDLGYSAGSLPETERAASEVLSLPISPQLTVDQQQRVVDSIQRFFVGAKSAAA